jgi:hypothetical protein
VDGLIPGDPRIVSGTSLLGDNLVIVGDGDVLIKHLLSTGDEALKLGGMNSH